MKRRHIYLAARYGPNVCAMVVACAGALYVLFFSTL